MAVRICKLNGTEGRLLKAFQKSRLPKMRPSRKIASFALALAALTACTLAVPASQRRWALHRSAAFVYTTLLPGLSTSGVDWGPSLPSHAPLATAQSLEQALAGLKPNDARNVIITNVATQTVQPDF